jgi:hypothetical protein
MKAVPTGWFSWNFTLAEGDRSLATIESSWWRERGSLSVEGTTYRVYRESLLGDFVLEKSGEVVARATKMSVFRREFVVTYRGREYTLRAHAPFRRAFLLLAGDERLGAITPDGMFSRNSEVDFPPDLPLELKAFLVWLTVLLWKRDAHSSSGG